MTESRENTPFELAMTTFNVEYVARSRFNKYGMLVDSSVDLPSNEIPVESYITTPCSTHMVSPLLFEVGNAWKGTAELPVKVTSEKNDIQEEATAWLETIMSSNPSSDLADIFRDGQEPSEECITSMHDQDKEQRFKPFHEENWAARLQELKMYVQEEGNCLVPHTYPSNPKLSRWVKRQRRQYKLMREGHPYSTMTEERMDILNAIGFIWDSHEVVWEEKRNELVAYRKKHGNCLVPSLFKDNPSLATWVKCQRRQYKLHCEGNPSAMTPGRIERLEQLGFQWELRSHGQLKKISLGRK